jgi:polyisoprenoid-binding protein YceI
MKKLPILIFAVLSVLSVNAQKYITKNGYIEFYGKTPLEEIKATNSQVASILDPATGDMVFQVLLKSFHFERALMEEHFNENYVESEKYPKAELKGKIADLSAVDFKKKGIYNIKVTGDLKIHNVTKNVTEAGTLEITDTGIVAKSKFKIRQEDFNIQIPSVVKDKIAPEMDVTVEMKYEPMSK